MKFHRCDKCASDISEYRKSSVALVETADENGNVMDGKDERWLLCSACFGKVKESLGRKMSREQMNTLPRREHHDAG